MGHLAWLDHNLQFPETSLALEDPNGLLAIGGDLSVDRLLLAYSQGIFPWYSDGQPIMWWTPSPRMILKPDELYLGKSNKKLIKKHNFTIKTDCNFEDVINACSSINRQDQDGTWITDEMKDAYIELHKLGHAHSVEAWQDDGLVGGLYGLALGKAFFGESMFSLESGASKVAFITLCRQLATWNFKLIDCQIHTEYLESFGAHEVERDSFENLLKEAIAQDDLAPQNWQSNWASNNVAT